MATEAQIRGFEAHVRRLMRTVDRVEDREVREIFRELRSAREELDDRIVALLARRGTSTFGPEMARTIRSEIQRVTTRVWNQYGQRLGRVDRELLEEAIGGQLEGIDRTIPGEIPGDPSVSEAVVLTSARYRALLVTRSDAIRGSAEEQEKHLSGIIRIGILTGKSPQAISHDMARSGWLGPLRRSDGVVIGVGARAETIARTEVNGVFNVTSEAAIENLNKAAPQLRLVKSWFDSDDELVRETHADAAARYAIGGATGPIPVDEDFEVGGFAAAMPHDPRLPASERVNCRCRVVSMSAGFLAERKAA